MSAATVWSMYNMIVATYVITPSDHPMMEAAYASNHPYPPEVLYDNPIGALQHSFAVCRSGF
jgi:hypothetical protein